ncbi:H-type lectin domain-containing protein [Massilia horti]|uniref:H-type lectin domain-containing protein n=1 Tax=Massilia horti TaxID=2562153 RepID=A0A4Y9T450_9BURK|nr:H-type lectin domain-containing protein [Massilia horti]TFW34917.1 hypothetical protein E4O92_02860 [Massilia horti]
MTTATSIDTNKLSEEVRQQVVQQQQFASFDTPMGLKVVTGRVGPGHTGIQFNPPFQAPPFVMMSICAFDIDRGANARLTCGPLANTITSNGFTAVLGTWADTGLYSASASWIAIGV